MDRSKSGNKEKSLRVVSPKLYSYITKELLDTHHIHSYDIQIDAVNKTEGMDVSIRYGESFSHKETSFFTHEQIGEISSEIKDFVSKTGEACTQIMIDDYFKIYAP